MHSGHGYNAKDASTGLAFNIPAQHWLHRCRQICAVAAQRTPCLLCAYIACIPVYVRSPFIMRLWVPLVSMIAVLIEVWIAVGYMPPATDQVALNFRPDGELQKRQLCGRTLCANSSGATAGLQERSASCLMCKLARASSCGNVGKQQAPIVCTCTNPWHCSRHCPAHHA